MTRIDLVPTNEQAAIILAARTQKASIMVEADAGCTKTSTLKMTANALVPQPLLVLAFNKKNAEDLQAVMPQWVTVKTFNGLGHGAWMKALPGKRLVLVDRKIGKIVTELFREEKFEAAGADWVTVRDWAEAARQAGIVHESFASKGHGLKPDTQESWFELSEEVTPDQTLWTFAREVLRRSTQLALEGQIDFDDQIYCSVLLGGIYPRFGLVMVDEAQDLSPLNHEQVRKAAAGRIIVVGDPKQAIYAFRGADSTSMAKLRALRPDWIDLGLHTTFRCPKIIVRRNLYHAPFFTAHENNPEGEAYDWLKKQREAPEQISFREEKADGWSWTWLKSLKQEEHEKIFVLCRNNAPLLSLAFKLIRQGVGPMMLGRDIGAGLVRLSEKLAPKDSTSTEELLKKLQAWEKSEIAKAQIMEKDKLIDSIIDRADCIRAVMENPGVLTAGDLRRVLETIFSKKFGEITLATGHKAKGLEEAIVVHLDPWRVPSKRALKEGGAALQQERNLKYVIETRTKRVFVEASLEDFI